MGGNRVSRFENPNIFRKKPMLKASQERMLKGTGFSNGNPIGMGLNSVQRTPKKVLAGVEKRLNNPFLAVGNNVLSRASVKLDLSTISGITIDYGEGVDHGPFPIKPEVVGGGKFVARTGTHVFADKNEVIESITIPYAQGREWMSALERFLELGMEEKVLELRALLESPEFKAIGFTLGTSITSEGPHVLIPGTYKHYTNELGFRGIHSAGYIRPSEKVEKGKPGFYTYLSMLTVRPEEGEYIFFTQGERDLIQGRTDFVIAFDLRDGIPIAIDYSKDDPYVESWAHGMVSLDQVHIRYMGKNDPKYFPSLLPSGR